MLFPSVFVYTAIHFERTLFHRVVQLNLDQLEHMFECTFLLSEHMHSFGAKLADRRDQLRWSNREL